MMSLVVPLLQSQIDAAQRLYRRLAMWRATNDAFGVLQQTLPGFDVHASLIKAAAVNQLYGTNVFAITRMAQHIVIVMQHRGGTPVDLSLVEDIATLRDSVEEAKPRRHLSFASKFAHFFISDTLFPIYDSYAAMILNYHMCGRATAPDSAPPYADYVAALKTLHAQPGIACSMKELDAYLWLTGLAIAWRKPRAAGKQVPINREVRELFAHGGDVAVDVAALLPTIRPTTV
jgi:hypothetical protein